MIAGSAPGTDLQPGQSSTDEVNLSQVYHLGTPGKYKIWITEPFFGGPHNVRNGFVRWNTVTVTVAK